jgi:HPt (histidine-containing phosphotransfer) domain-containing protein
MAVIDWAQFNDNFQYYDKTIIIEVIDLFFEEYDSRIAALQKNIDENDFKALAFNAHSLKSVISNYMAPEALEVTRKLEELAKNKSEGEINDAFSKLKVTTRELVDELKDYVAKLD